MQIELDTGILRGYLELDILELKNPDIEICFNEARRMIKHDQLSIIQKQLTIFRVFTSIVAQVATLASLTNRKSWPILSLTAAMPLIEATIQLTPWRKMPHQCTSPVTSLMLLTR